MSIKDYIGSAKTLLVDIPNAELKAELLMVLLDVQTAALDLHERLSQSQQENSKLKAERDARDEIAETRKQLFYARHAYWRKDEPEGGAYCPICWDTKRLLVHIMQEKGGSGLCNSCKSRHLHAYDGPRPNEGDAATPEEPHGAPPTQQKPSRKQQWRSI